MQNLKILNTRDVKIIKEFSTENYGYFPEKDYAYLQSENGKIYLINKDVARIDLSKLHLDKVGLYFAEEHNGSFRLSKEGVQLLAKEAQESKKELKNIVVLNREEMKKYFQGEDLDKDLGEKSKFVLLKYEKDLFGCAKYKEKKILNFLPKIHRVEVIL